MNSKYPSAYRLCYETDNSRIIGVKRFMGSTWCIEYVDNKEDTCPEYKVLYELYSNSPILLQDKLDSFARSKGWRIVDY